jgi:hypothetical protein
MRSSNLTWLLALALSLILVMGCSNGAITDPSFDLDRTLSGGNGGGNGGEQGGQGGGPGGGNGPNGPDGPHGPKPDFEIDCERLFDVDYQITLPCGTEFPMVGEVKILDADCSAEESDVIVIFKFEFEDSDFPPRFKAFPGTKVTTNTGLLYSGEISKSKEGKHHSFERTINFELLVSEQPGDPEPETIIEGWLHRNRMDEWSLPNGKEKEKERDWHVDVSGVEIVD